MYSSLEVKESHYRKNTRRVSYEKEIYSGVALYSITAYIIG